MDCSPPGSSVQGDSPGKNTGVDCHFLLQRILILSNLKNILASFASPLEIPDLLELNLPSQCIPQLSGVWVTRRLGPVTPKGIWCLESLAKERLNLLSVFCAMCSVAQWCLTLCNPMVCSPPGSSVRGIFQVIVLEWVAISSFRGSSHPGTEPLSPASPALAGRFFTTEPPGRWSLCFLPHTKGGRSLL